MNEAIFRYLNDFAGQSNVLDQLIVFGAETLGVILLLGLLIFLFSHEHGRRQGFYNIIVILGSAFLAWGITEIINKVYPSPRPFLVLDSVNKLIDHGGMDSFPSGHAAFFSAVATSLYFYHKRFAALYIIGAVVIGFSRIVAGIHWPVDIIMGYIIGGGVAVFVYYSSKNIMLRISTHLSSKQSELQKR